jgi:F0F1-type ATP synthase epsilon subunit
VRILGDVVSVLTGAAINVNEIDLQTIEAAQKRAKESLAKAKAQKQIQITEVDELESFLRFATAQQLIKKRRK